MSKSKFYVIFSLIERIVNRVVFTVNIPAPYDITFDEAKLLLNHYVINFDLCYGRFVLPNGLEFDFNL